MKRGIWWVILGMNLANLGAAAANKGAYWILISALLITLALFVLIDPERPKS